VGLGNAQGLSTQLNPHIHAGFLKVFGLAFFKKRVGLGNAQGFFI